MIQDSLNKHRDREKHPDLYQNFDVFLYMKLDTTVRFHIVKDSLIKAKQESVITDYLTQYQFSISRLIDACGYVNDKRLVEPLINLLNENIKRKDELETLLTGDNTFSEKETLNSKKEARELLIYEIKDALIQMKIEPYYSDFFKSKIHSIEELKREKLVDIETFSIILHDQESFLELSKYLHCSAYTNLSSEGPYGTAYVDACREIKKYIKNKELQDILNSPDFDLERDRFKIYDWMQENYGKYEIKRLW